MEVLGYLHDFWSKNGESQELHINSLMPELLQMIFDYMSESDKDIRSIRLTCKQWKAIAPKDQLDRPEIHKTLHLFRSSFKEMVDGHQIINAEKFKTNSICLWISDLGELGAITQECRLVNLTDKTITILPNLAHKIFDLSLLEDNQTEEKKKYYAINILFHSDCFHKSGDYDLTKIIFKVYQSEDLPKSVKVINFYIMKLIESAIKLDESETWYYHYIPLNLKRRKIEFEDWLNPSLWFKVLTHPDKYPTDKLFEKFSDVKL